MPMQIGKEGWVRSRGLSDTDLHFGVWVAEWKRFMERAVFEGHKYNPLTASHGQPTTQRI